MVLSITQKQLDAMTREYVVERLHRFLVERSSDPALRALLASPKDCRTFWLARYDRFAGLDEHGLAVRLIYLLAAQAHGLEPRLADVAGDDGEIAMKTRMEERGILAFAAFDD